jgi:hypothetical protein
MLDSSISSKLLLPYFLRKKLLLPFCFRVLPSFYSISWRFSRVFVYSFSLILFPPRLAHHFSYNMSINLCFLFIDFITDHKLRRILRELWRVAAAVVLVLGEASVSFQGKARRGEAAMMSFKAHEGFGQVGALNQASNGTGAPLPWWAGPRLLYGEPAPEETRRDGQFQVVPGAQGSPDPAPPSAKRTAPPEVLKFSVFQGEAFLSLCSFACLLIIFDNLFRFSKRKKF